MCQGTREKKTQTTWQSVPADVKWSPEGNESCPHNLHLNLLSAPQQEPENICPVLAWPLTSVGGGNPQHSTSGGKSTLTITELLQLEKRMSPMCWLVSCTDGCFTLAPGAQGISYDAPCQDHTSSAQNHLSVHRYGPTKHRLCKFLEDVGGCNSQCAQAAGEGKARRKRQSVRLWWSSEQDARRLTFKGQLWSCWDSCAPALWMTE